jgi:GDPmannose 4,6-dehydratase
MWLMLQQDKPEDYVIATGESHSVQEFLEAAFRYVGLDYRRYLVVDEKLFRPAEVNILMGDPQKARLVLNWKHEVRFEEPVHEMVEGDLKWYARESAR